MSRKHLPIPTTVLTSSITNYCRNPKKIMFVLEKDSAEKQYSKIAYEIKKGLLAQEYEKFPQAIKSRIYLDLTSATGV